MMHPTSRAFLLFFAVAPALPAAAATVDASTMQRLGHTESDGESEDRVRFRALSADVAAPFGPIGLSFGLTQLDRTSDNAKTGAHIAKASRIFTPGLAAAVAPGVRVALSDAIIRTTARNSHTSGDYALDASRPAVSVTLLGQRQAFGAGFAAQTWAQKRYEVGGYPLVDRDYIPAQADLNYSRQATDRLGLAGQVRYSNYDRRVYADEDSGAVPSSPTAGQVLDYLLTVAVSGKYRLNSFLDAGLELRRKGALDVNGLTGDEYVVARSGLLTLTARVLEGLTVGASAGQSSGSKVHTVQGRSYDYASRVESYGATVAVRL